MKTKIIATLGPVSQDLAIFQKMVDNGIDFIRINTAYGNYQQYDQFLDNLNKVQTKKEIKVILDIKKLDMLDYFVKNGLEYLALSFTESKEQVKAIKNIATNSKIIAKIESKKGISNFNEIIDSCWGIMIARGDLGEAVSLEKIPPLQKEMAQKTICKKKFLITATEMLLSMVNNPEPTRAEVSDVANAVFEQSSAVMLSEETAIGRYPVETVAMMRKIIKEAEAWYYGKNKSCQLLFKD